MQNVSGFNFKGVAIGNGVLDPIKQLNGFNYLKATGLIDKRQQDELKLIADEMRELYKDGKYEKLNELEIRMCKID